MTITATRTHDFCYGHTVTGHHIDGEPGKCRHLHGHNGTVEWTITVPELDDLGRTLDFGVMKTLLDSWLEKNWDHKFLIWENDPRANQLAEVDPDGVVLVDFNPTAENLAYYLVHTIGPRVLRETKATLIEVKFHETRKCSVNVRM